MSQTDKDTIRDIFSSKEKLETAMDFMDIWGNSDLENCRNSDREFIKTIKDDKQKEQAAVAFEELWNNRTKIYAECILEDLQNKGFVVRDDSTVFKKIDDDISLGFWNGIKSRNEYYYAYGFTFSDKEKKISNKKELKRILKENVIIKNSGDDNDDYWVANAIYFDNIEDNKILIGDFITNLLEQFDLLEKKYTTEIQQSHK